MNKKIILAVSIIAGIGISVWLFTYCFPACDKALAGERFYNLEIDGLKEEYYLDETIQAKLRFHYFGKPCGPASLQILQNGETIWGINATPGCDSNQPPIYGNSTSSHLRVNADPIKDLNGAGNYVIKGVHETMEDGSFSVEKQFTIKEIPKNEENENIPLERGAPLNLRVVDKNNNYLSTITSNEEVTFQYDLMNKENSDKKIEIEFFVRIDEDTTDDEKIILYEKLVVELEPNESKLLTWNHTFDKSGYYAATIIPKGQPSQEVSFFVLS